MAADTAVVSGTARPGVIVAGTLRERRRALLGWGVALAVIALIYVSFYPLVGDDQMAEMAEMMPEGMAEALGYDRLGDAAGYLTATVFGLLGPALLLVFAIGAGARLLAGQEEDGTLELELTHPVARRSIYAQRLLALWAMIAALLVVLTVVSLLLVAAFDMDVTTGGVLAAGLGLLLFVLAHGTLALAVGAATGRRVVALGAAAGVAVLGYIADALGPMVEGFSWLTSISPWSWYLAPDPIASGLEAGGVLLLVALTVVAAVAGLARYDRRDLGV